jgi:hypothetical protein
VTVPSTGSVILSTSRNERPPYEDFYVLQDFLMGKTVKSTTFWDVTPCILVDVNK